MTAKTLRGCVTTGCGDAKNWGIDAIRKATGCNGLLPATFNVRLDTPHKLRVDATLSRGDRTDRRGEDLFFERCVLALGGGMVRAWIARTSTNFHGEHVLEIMAEEWLRKQYRLEDNDPIDVQVFVE